MEDRLNKDKIIDASEDFIGFFQDYNVPLNSFEFTRFDETIDRNFFKADAGAIDEFGTIFGLIGLIICSVVIYGMLSRIVQAQRRNIGLFMSMGARKQKIISHYLKITLLLSSIGAVIGMFLGYGFSIGMVRLVGELYPLQNYAFPIAVGEYVFGAIITLAVSSVFSVLSVLPILNVTPRDAMTAFFNRIKVTKQTISEKIFGWIPIFRSIHMRVSLREVFLRKKKSLVSILAVSTSMIILIVSLGMVENMVGSLNDYYDKYNTADVEIQLETPQPLSAINTFMQNNQSDDDIPHYESYISVFTKFETANNESYIELLCYQKNSTFRNFNIISGDIDSKKDINTEKILLGQSIAGKFDISVADEVKIGILDEKTVEVAGLIGELIDTSAFWTIEAFHQDNISRDYFGMHEGVVNGILLDLSDDLTVEEREAIKDEFQAQFNVATWTNTEDAKRSIMGLMESMMGFLFVFLGVGIIIGVVFTFNMMYMGLLSRMNDFLAFKAMGTDPKYIRKMIFWEHVLLSVFSLIITVPIGYVFYAWSMDYLMSEQFYFPVSIPWYTWPLVFLLSLFSIWLATRRIMKRIKNLILADELRQRIIS
ncbi:MAG: ABC transporter permease [Promethearchaeia archaeon]